MCAMCAVRRARVSRDVCTVCFVHTEIAASTMGMFRSSPRFQFACCEHRELCLLRPMRSTRTVYDERRVRSAYV